MKSQVSRLASFRVPARAHYHTSGPGGVAHVYFTTYAFPGDGGPGDAMKAGTSLVRRSSRHRSASVDAADGPSDGPTRSNARQASRGTRSKAKTGKKGTKATRSASVDVLNDENTAEEGAGGTRGKNHAPPKSALTRTYSTTRRANALRYDPLPPPPSAQDTCIGTESPPGAVMREQGASERVFFTMRHHVAPSHATNLV